MQPRFPLFGDFAGINSQKLVDLFCQFVNRRNGSCFAAVPGKWEVLPWEGTGRSPAAKPPKACRRHACRRRRRRGLRPVLPPAAARKEQKRPHGSLFPRCCLPQQRHDDGIGEQKAPVGQRDAIVPGPQQACPLHRGRPPQQGGVVLPVAVCQRRGQSLRQPQGEHKCLLPVPAGAVIQRQRPHVFRRQKSLDVLRKAIAPPPAVARRPRPDAEVFPQLPVDGIVAAFVPGQRRIAYLIMPVPGLLQHLIVRQIALRRRILIGAACRHAHPVKCRSRLHL